jgi:hypothetical protein
MCKYAARRHIPPNARVRCEFIIQGFAFLCGEFLGVIDALNVHVERNVAGPRHYRPTLQRTGREQQVSQAAPAN